MVTVIKIDSVVCLGCTSQIHSLFVGISGVYGIKVDVVNNVIEVSHTEEITESELLKIFENRINTL